MQISYQYYKLEKCIESPNGEKYLGLSVFKQYNLNSYNRKEMYKLDLLD